jgi:hypothetical protein
MRDHDPMPIIIFALVLLALFAIELLEPVQIWVIQLFRPG